jgi:hypothetical protein
MYLIYDIEIAKAIPPKHPVKGIEYCNGWSDFENMGIAVIGYKWSHEANARHTLSAIGFLDMLMQYEEEDYKLVGFNSRSFDDKLLAANDLAGIETHYDLLEQIRVAAGFKGDYKSVPKGYKYSLDNIAQDNGAAKTGQGALAPVLWQQGKNQEVIDYCINDVLITEKILQLGLAGELVDPNTGNKLQLASI